MHRRSGGAAGGGRSGRPDRLVVRAVEDARVVDPLDLVDVAGVRDDGVPSSAAPSVESENDREFCGAAGAMLTRRSGSRAIGSPPSASSASIIFNWHKTAEHNTSCKRRRLRSFARSRRSTTIRRTLALDFSSARQSKCCKSSENPHCFIYSTAIPPAARPLYNGTILWHRYYRAR